MCGSAMSDIMHLLRPLRHSPVPGTPSCSRMTRRWRTPLPSTATLATTSRRGGERDQNKPRRPWTDCWEAPSNEASTAGFGLSRLGAVHLHA